MSVEVPVSFKHKWRDDYIALSQQKGSRLRPYVRLQSGTKGKSDNWERIGSTTAQQITSRHASTPLISTPHSRRRCILGDFNVADLIDSTDRSKMMLNLEGPYMDAMVWAMGRKMDDVVIAAMTGNATSVSSSDAESNVALPSAQKVVHASAGLTLAKILSAKKILDAAEVDPDTPRCLAVTAAQMEDLLGINQVTSGDYNTQRTLVEGEVGSWMGFHVIRTQRLGTDGDGNRQVLAWAQDGVGLSIGAQEDMKVEISNRADKNYSTQVKSNNNMPDLTAMSCEKLCELRETPNVKSRAILSQAHFNGKVQRLFLREVRSSEWKRRASQVDEDIVWSMWKHIAVQNRTGWN